MASATLSRDEQKADDEAAVNALREASRALRKIAKDAPKNGGVRSLLRSFAGNLGGLAKTFEANS